MNPLHMPVNPLDKAVVETPGGSLRDAPWPTMVWKQALSSIWISTEATAPGVAKVIGVLELTLVKRQSPFHVVCH